MLADGSMTQPLVAAVADVGHNEGTVGTDKRHRGRLVGIRKVEVRFAKVRAWS